MPEHLLLGPEELEALSPLSGLAGKAGGLLRAQKENWELLRRGYESLSRIQERLFEFDGFTVKVQFNPGRIVSSSAKVDEKSIRERPCFLCRENLPPDQRGFLYMTDYLVLCNPFPIFPEHFTIPHIDHRPQEILPALPAMLALAREFSPHYTLVYNGPRCGASAPDHLHLQAGTTGFMSSEGDFDVLKESREEKLVETSRVRISSLRDYLRTVLILDADRPLDLEGGLRGILVASEHLSGDSREPMVNLLTLHRGSAWRVILFARAKHRPSIFSAKGEERMLLSPAAVDMGGVLTLPLERDFQRITKDHLIQMYEEVSLDPSHFKALKEEIRRAYR